MAFHALLAQAVRVINLKNRVLLHHAEQEQQAQTGKYVHRLKGDQQRNNAERNCQRQRQKDCDRVNERFELGRQNHVHKDERQNNRQQKVVTGAGELLRASGQSGSVGGVQVLVFRKLIHLGDDCRL